MQFTFRPEPSPMFDLSCQPPPVWPDDPNACRDCRGAGVLRPPSVRVVPEGDESPPPERACERCHGIGLDPEPPPDAVES